MEQMLRWCQARRAIALFALLTTAAATHLLNSPDGIVRAQLALRGKPLAEVRLAAPTSKDFPVGIMVHELVYSRGRYAGFVDSTGTVVLSHDLPGRFPMSVDVSAALTFLTSACIGAALIYVGIWVGRAKMNKGFPVALRGTRRGLGE